MRAVRTSLGVCVVVCAAALVAPSFAAAPPSTNKTHHHHVIHGKVVEVDHGKKSGHGLIKVEVHEHHGKGQPIKGSEAKGKHHVVTVHVNHETRFEKVIHTGGKGGETREVLAHFRDVEPGMHVRIKLGHDHAREVSILVEHHKKK